MIKMKRLLVLLTLVMFTLYGCSSSLNEYSPDQVIQNALNEKNEGEAYYAESTWTTKEQGKVTETMTMKEWSSKDGKKRVETIGKDESENGITVNDGARLITYMPGDKKAFIFESEELASLNQQSPKEQAEQMLKLIKDTHEIEVIGEEKIADRNTFHLKATVKEDQSLIGNQEIWIDKENWFVLKTKSDTDEVTVKWMYTKIEFNPQMPDDLFTIDLPDDVEIESLESMLDTREVTFEEAKDQLRTSFLYIPDTKDLKIAYVGLLDLGSEMERKEVTLEYEKEGLPYLSISIFETLAETEDGQLEAIIGEKMIHVRGQEGMWSEKLRTLYWQEEGLTYSIIVLDPNLSIEKLQKLLERMVHFN